MVFLRLGIVLQLYFINCGNCGTLQRLVPLQGLRVEVLVLPVLRHELQVFEQLVGEHLANELRRHEPNRYFVLLVSLGDELSFPNRLVQLVSQELVSLEEGLRIQMTANSDSFDILHFILLALEALRHLGASRAPAQRKLEGRRVATVRIVSFPGLRKDLDAS